MLEDEAMAPSDLQEAMLGEGPDSTLAVFEKQLANVQSLKSTHC